jgi:hypothetical protein
MRKKSDLCVLINYLSRRDCQPSIFSERRSINFKHHRQTVFNLCTHTHTLMLTLRVHTRDEKTQLSMGRERFFCAHGEKKKREIF